MTKGIPRPNMEKLSSRAREPAKDKELARIDPRTLERSTCTRYDCSK